MKITSKQQEIIKQKVLELAPECEVKITGRKLKRSYGHNKANEFLRKVAEYRLFNGEIEGMSWAYDDNGKLTGDKYNYKYLPLKTALHEFGHIVQVKTGIMEWSNYDFNEITTEFLALKMMKKYFTDMLPLETENASREYIRNYYDNWARKNRMVEMPEERLERIFTETVEIMEPYLEELAKAVAEAK
jgi:hypothetical protein